MIYNQDSYSSSRYLRRDVGVNKTNQNDVSYSRFSSSYNSSNDSSSRQHHYLSSNNRNQAAFSIEKSSNHPRRRASREITSTKEFEDRATTVLAEIRKQRRTMKLEYASNTSVSVSSRTRSGGWRETMRRNDQEEKNTCLTSHQIPPKPSYLSQKRNSVSEFVGKVIRKLSISKPDESQDSDKPHLNAEQLTNPLEFILMKEEYLKKNPPSPTVKNQATTTTTGNNPESIMDSLKKMVKKINPKREFPGETKPEDSSLVNFRKQSEMRMALFDERMKKYAGASITPFNSHSARL